MVSNGFIELLLYFKHYIGTVEEEDDYNNQETHFIFEFLFSWGKKKLTNSKIIIKHIITKQKCHKSQISKSKRESDHHGQRLVTKASWLR